MLYDYECRSCGSRATNVYATMSDRHNAAPDCCGEKMTLVILEAPMGFVDNMQEYLSPVTGQPVTSRRQRKYEMEKGGYIDANDFAKSHAQRKAEKEQRKAEIARIKSEMPKDLKEVTQQITKAEADKFKSSL
jgi:hypothetical protein